MSPMTLYGAPGWGSVIVEAMLEWCDARYEFVDVEGFDRPGPARAVLTAVNPLAQVPALVLPDGQLMTESAAITLWLSETYPDRALAPAPGTPDRAAFLRRLVWLVAAVYPTFTYGDYPARWAPGDPAGLEASTLAHREALWRQFESEVGDGPWVLGRAPSALDVYVAAMTHWRPRRAWFDAHTPRLAKIASATLALPRLAGVWRRNFPPAAAAG
jgi:GST-like protein